MPKIIVQLNLNLAVCWVCKSGSFGFNNEYVCFYIYNQSWLLFFKDYNVWMFYRL